MFHESPRTFSNRREAGRESSSSTRSSISTRRALEPPEMWSRDEADLPETYPIALQIPARPVTHGQKRETER